MVDTGATSHIITDIAKFKKSDDRFQAETHCVELSDGTRSNGVAEVCLIDCRGRRLNTTLTGIVYPLIPAGHLLRESSYCQRSDRDLQGREGHPTTQTVPNSTFMNIIGYSTCTQ